MTNHIDHYESAKVLLKQAEGAKNMDAVQAVVAGANAHAVLALVDAQREANRQARIANLIALSQVKAGDGSLPFRGLVMEPVDEYSVGVTDEIKKGLGL